MRWNLRKRSIGSVSISLDATLIDSHTNVNCALHVYLPSVTTYQTLFGHLHDTFWGFSSRDEGCVPQPSPPRIVWNCRKGGLIPRIRAWILVPHLFEYRFGFSCSFKDESFWWFYTFDHILYGLGLRKLFYAVSHEWFGREWGG